MKNTSSPVELTTYDTRYIMISLEFNTTYSRADIVFEREPQGFFESGKNAP